MYHAFPREGFSLAHNKCTLQADNGRVIRFITFSTKLFFNKIRNGQITNTAKLAPWFPADVTGGSRTIVSHYAWPLRVNLFMNTQTPKSPSNLKSKKYKNDKNETEKKTIAWIWLGCIVCLPCMRNSILLSLSLSPEWLQNESNPLSPRI